MKMTSAFVRRFLYANFLVALVVAALGATLYLKRIHRYDRLIVEAGRAHGVDPRLVTALIWTESRFRPDQVGSSGEIGLMQVTETAGREWGEAVKLKEFSKEMLFHPEHNIHAGVWYLGRAIKYWSAKCSDPLPFALAEYNAGRSRARRWQQPEVKDSREFVERISYPTTKKYVESILERYRGGV